MDYQNRHISVVVSNCWHIFTTTGFNRCCSFDASHRIWSDGSKFNFSIRFPVSFFPVAFQSQTNLPPVKCDVTTFVHYNSLAKSWSYLSAILGTCSCTYCWWYIKQRFVELSEIELIFIFGSLKLIFCKLELLRSVTKSLRAINYRAIFLFCSMNQNIMNLPVHLQLETQISVPINSVIMFFKTKWLSLSCSGWRKTWP